MQLRTVRAFHFARQVPFARWFSGIHRRVWKEKRRQRKASSTHLSTHLVRVVEYGLAVPARRDCKLSAAHNFAFRPVAIVRQAALIAVCAWLFMADVHTACHLWAVAHRGQVAIEILHRERLILKRFGFPALIKHDIVVTQRCIDYLYYTFLMCSMTGLPIDNAM